LAPRAALASAAMLQPSILLSLLSLDPVVGVPRNWGKGVGIRNSTTLEESLRQGALLLRDHLHGSTGQSSSCSKDMRHQMPACLQSCDMWCWATVESMAWNYYKVENECKNWECQAATYKVKKEWGKKAPPSCCPSADHCSPKDGSSPIDDYCDPGGGEEDIIDGLEHFTGAPSQSTVLWLSLSLTSL